MSAKGDHGYWPTKSLCWWMQVALSVLASSAISLHLLTFVRAATGEATLVRLEPSGISDSQLSTYAFVSSDQGMHRGNHIGIQAISLPVGDSIKLRVVTSPAIEKIPRPTLQRMHWMLLQQTTDDLWSCVSNRGRFDETGYFSYRFLEPGRYLIAVALPPVTLQQLHRKDSDYIAATLTGRDASRCGITYVAVQSNDSAKEVALPNRDQPQADGITPAPALALDEKRPDKANRPIAPISRDLSTSLEGDETSATQESQLSEPDPSAELKHAAAAVTEVPMRMESQPFTLEDIRRARVDGILPEIEIRYSPEQLARLTADEWQSLAEEYSMPFVTVPNKQSESEFPRWPLLLPNGQRLDMDPGEIRKVYGFQILPLSQFSQAVQDRTRERFGDPVSYYKCSAYRGFLLSDVLLKAIHAALVQNGTSSSDLGRINRITVSLVIEPRLASPAGSLSIIARNVTLGR